MTFKFVAEAWIASREHCTDSLGRIQFSVQRFGPIPIDKVTEDDVDRALVCLVNRGKLKGGRGKSSVATPTGEPLSGATVNRFVYTLAGIFKYARKLRVLP